MTELTDVIADATDGDPAQDTDRLIALRGGGLVHLTVEDLPSGGGGGTVEEVAPGTGIDVDATDPAAPIVSIESGVYRAGGTDVAVADGGTGASDASGARTNLGLAIGTDIPSNAQVAAKADDSAVVHDTGDETIAGVKTFSSDPLIPDEAYDATNWNGVLEPPTKNAVRDKIESLSAVYQPLDSDLTAIAALTTTSFGRALLELADAAALRTAGGLGTIATQAANNVTITGGSVSGITDLAIADGGTGASTAVAALTALGIVRTHLTSDQTISSQAALQNVTGLSFAVAANEVWAFEFVLFTSGTSAGDYDFAVTAPTSPDILRLNGFGPRPGGTSDAVVTVGTTATAASTDVAFGGLSTGNGAMHTLYGLIDNGANAGTLQLQFSQTASTAANTSILAGSYMVATRIA